MSKDLINIRLSSSATSIAETLKENFYFPDAISVCRFAFSYAIVNYSSLANPAELDDQYPSDGSNYNTGTVNQDGIMTQLISYYYPECDTPFRYIRAFIILGLEKINEKLAHKEIQSILELL